MKAVAAIKERPILMHARSIIGILEGRKTQTRRIIKNPGKYTGIRNCAFCCSHGQSGDRLWVKETFWHRGTCPIKPVWPRGHEQFEGGCIRYDASEHSGLDFRLTEGSRKYPSIFMPRWTSRLTLEITGISVQKIQEISEQDIVAEGADVPRCVKCGYTRADCQTHFDHHLCGVQQPVSGVPTFMALWDDTNGKGAWERNDWVWVIEFRRLP